MGTAGVLSSAGHSFHCCKAELQRVCSVPLARSSSGCTLLNLAVCFCTSRGWEPQGEPSGMPGWVHRAPCPPPAHQPSLLAGWKLNPVVGAVYGPEFYAGKSSALPQGCAVFHPTAPPSMPLFPSSLLPSMHTPLTPHLPQCHIPAASSLGQHCGHRWMFQHGMCCSDWRVPGGHCCRHPMFVPSLLQ